jgi:hypothetical protein
MDAKCSTCKGQCQPYNTDKAILGKGGVFDVHVHGKPEFVEEHQRMSSRGKYIKTVFLRLRKQQVLQTFAHYTLYRDIIPLLPLPCAAMKFGYICLKSSRCPALSISFTLIQSLTIFLRGVYTFSRSPSVHYSLLSFPFSLPPPCPSPIHRRSEQLPSQCTKASQQTA